MGADDQQPVLGVLPPVQKAVMAAIKQLAPVSGLGASAEAN